MQGALRLWPLALALGMALLLAACGEGDKGPAVASPTTKAPTLTTITPTQQLEAHGIEGFKVFGSQIEVALSEGDVGFFLDRALLSRHQCSATDVQFGILPCRQAGQTLEGIWVGPWRSQWTLASLADYKQFLVRFFDSVLRDATDDFGSGEAALYAIGQTRSREAQVFFGMVTAISDTANGIERIVHAMEFVFEDGRWRFVADVQTGGALAAELLSGARCLAADGYCASWERWEPSEPTASLGDNGFSIYLPLREMSAGEISKVDLTSVELEDKPLISLGDIIGYSKEKHEIELTASAYESLRELEVPVTGRPFVVCAGNDPIYGGAFWTMASSISFDGVVILKPFDKDRHTIRIQLAYPASELFTGADPRSDSRLLDSLERGGKLS